MKIAFNPSTVAALITPPNNKDITFDLRGRNIFARGVKFCGTDTNTWRDIKINNVSIGSNTLDLRNGSNTTLTNTNGVVTINSTWRPVVDNLTSDSTTSSLSANQGRVLAGLINGKSDSNHNHDGRYLRLNGSDTMTGVFKAKANQYNDGYDGAINMNNSDIYGLNSIYTADRSDAQAEGIHFWRDSTHVDTLRMVDGKLLFTPNRPLGGSGTEQTVLHTGNSHIKGGIITINGSSLTPLTSLPSHTHSWTSITDKLVAGNEFNIVNAGFNAGMWFNYVPINDRSKTATITGYHFGNGATGYTSINASGFIKKGSNSNYVLLGDGGHKLESSLRVAYASNADMVDGYHATSGNNKPWGTIPVITAGGYMDIGKHLEFHFDNTTGSDYSTILRCTGNYSNIVNLPSASGTLALKSEIPTSVKNPYSLTLLANGTTLATYDGSVSKIVNLTYDNVGAAAKNHTHNSLEPWASYITGDSHATALKSLFNENKTSIPRNKFISMLGSAYDNTSYYMGYFLNNYNNNPYGGFFVAHYDTAYYVGISNGSFTQHRLVYSTDIPNSLKNPHALTISLNGTSLGPYDGSVAKNINITPGSIGAATSNHTHPYLPLSGGTVTGNIILKGGTSADMTYAGNVHPYIRFDNSDSSLNISLIFTDYDSYRRPAGIKLVGNQENEWFEATNIYATTFYGALSGNASTASKWATARTLSLTGSITGSVSFNGSGNITLATTTNHTHTFASLTSKPTTLSGYGITDAIEKKLIISKSDYLCYIILLCKIGTNSTNTQHTINGTFWTTSAGGTRYQAAYINIHCSDWSSGHNEYFVFTPFGIGTLCRLVTCTYQSNKYIAVISENIQACNIYFDGSYSNILFTPVLYYTSNTGTIGNSEIYNSISEVTSYKKIAFTTDNVASATKLTSSAGSATLPIYFSDGKPVACTASSVFSNLSNSGNNLSITVAGQNRTLTVGYATSAGSATKVIVNLHTANDTNYPLVWSNLANTNSVTENQLYKSWSDLYYNPKNKRLTVGGSVVASSFVKSGGTSLQLLRADGGIATFNWSGQSGLPTWLWGGNNLHSYYVYNPSNFRVAYAASAGNADTLDGYHASSLVKFYLSPMASDAPADSAKNWFVNTMPSSSGAIVYNVPGSEKTIIAGKSSGALGHMLQLNYDDTYLRILRYYNGSWKSTNWEKISAGYADSAGSVAWSNVTGKPSSLKNPYSLNVFGVAYDGSVAKTVTTSTFVSLLSEGTSTVTDGTMFITSYASNSGFADTNAVNVPYKRKAIHLWEYIKAKTDSLYATKGHNHDDRYLRLTGGTMSNTNKVTNLNADLLDGVHLNGIFTAFGNNAHNITATIGGVTKEFRVNYASDADTLDGEHASSFVRAGHYESADLNKLDTYSFIRSVNSQVSSTSPKGNIGWYNVILLVHRNGDDDGPNYIGLIALGMTSNVNDIFFRCRRTDPWKTIIHSNNYTEFINNYYWANVKISTSSSTTTSPTVSNLTATSSIRMGNIYLLNTNEINSTSGIHLNYQNSGNISLCAGGGKVGIGTTSPTYKLDVNGDIHSSGTINCNALNVGSTLSIKDSVISCSAGNISILSKESGSLLINSREVLHYDSDSIDISNKTSFVNRLGLRTGTLGINYSTDDVTVLIGSLSESSYFEFRPAMDGLLLFLKVRKLYSNTYFLCIAKNCEVIKANNFGTYLARNSRKDCFGDGEARIFIYKLITESWYEFYCG